ncbi:hypothetical protein [Sulfurimonas sp.]|uniref:hypothetical protein n=1 Tax=Sulfurimonas sp. TaxID=2022749 RepID=UPI0025E49F9C|nr:hypothetical protein [Sulfurimonas sp.]
MKIFTAKVIDVSRGKIGLTEQFVIKTNSKARAWEEAILIAFTDLFSTGKMITIQEQECF